VQRRRAIGLRRIHVRLAAEQFLDRLAVAALDGVNERVRGLCAP
jgi:hypothetical protein